MSISVRRVCKKELLPSFRRFYATNFKNLEQPEHLNITVPSQSKAHVKDPLLPLMWKLISDHERSQMRRYSNAAPLLRRLSEMLRYNLADNSRYFPVNVREAYLLLEEPSKVTSEKLYLADVMGCCLRIATAMLTAGDDIVDESTIRYGKPCWYTLAPSPHVALNDSWLGCFLHAQIASENLSGTPVYPRALDIINECYIEYLMGQYLDLDAMARHKQSGNLDLDFFTFEFLKLTGEYKMAPAIILKPLALALLLTGVDPMDEVVSRDVSAKIGFLYQVQNDFLDCYETDHYRRCGTDIEDGKPSWLIVTALERADDHQRRVLKQNYGMKDQRAVERVKQIYDELNLHGVYLQFAKQFYEDMDKIISELPRTGVVYKYALNELYNVSCH